MSDKDDQATNVDTNLLDALLRLKTLETLLINKGIVTREEYYQEMERVARFVAKRMLKKANIQGDLDAILDEFKKDIVAAKGTDN